MSPSSANATPLAAAAAKDKERASSGGEVFAEEQEDEEAMLPSPQEQLLVAAEVWYQLWKALTEQTLSFSDLEAAAVFFHVSKESDSGAGNELEILSQTAWAANKHLTESREKAASGLSKISSSSSAPPSLPVHPWPVGSVDAQWCARRTPG